MKQRFFLLFCLLLILGISIISPVNAQDNDTTAFPYWIEMMQDPDANFFETQRAFELYWQNREVTKGSGYKPFRRWEYMMSQRVSDQGVKPAPDRELKAFQQLVTNKGARNLDGNWSELGPFTVPSGYNGYRGLGRLNAIAFHPTNPNVIYVGAPSGGLWYTNDHGSSWVVLTDHLPTLGVSAIIVDAEDPDVIYIGTGDRDAGDAPGLGVWRSIDGGTEWEPWNNGMGNVTVGRMIQHPDDSQIILAATSGGMFRSDNGGAFWTQARTGNFKELVFKPDNANVVYAATGGTFYRSTDNGISYTAVNNGLPGGARGVIGVSPANPDVVYFLLTNSDSYKGIYLSEDAGLSFSVRSTTPNIMSWDCTGGSGGQAWYDLDIAVDPLDPTVVYAGGVNCFKSTNGGINWSIRSHWYGGCGVQSVHADLHILEYSPINNRLYAGNDGGFYWTEDGGVSWTEISNGLVISQAYKIGQSKTNPDFVINGYQDNGTSVVNGNTWVAVGGGDGMECAYDPTDQRYSYYTLYYGDISRNFNNNGNGQIAGNGVNGITESGAWVTPFLIDHEDGNIMFAGFKNVWRSTNIKAGNVNNVQWQKISTMNNSNMSVLVQSKANRDVIYAASGSKLYRTDNAKDATVSWTTLTGSLPVSANITAIECSPFDENVVFMAQQTSIYKSVDKGQSWQSIGTGLTNVQINSIAYYANSNEGLYLGTDIGVFYRDASMTEWIYFGNGMPASVKVTELEIYYSPDGPAGDLIRAGTYGRGLWSSPPYFGSLQAALQPETDSLTAGCNISFTDLTLGTPYTWLWTFEGGSPATSTEQHPQNITYPNEGVFSVTLTVENPLGSDTYVCEDCIVVLEAAPPAVNFVASQTVGCAGMVIPFTDLTTNCPESWDWTFNPATVVFVDGTNAQSANPVVQFLENTSYSVSLTATNSSGPSTLTIEDYILLGGFPVPFTENFELATFEAAGWEVQNPDNLRTWDINTLNDGTNAAWMNFFNYTNFDQRDFLVSPPLNFQGVENMYLSFEYAYAQRYMQTDSLIVSISPDCGNSWQRVYANGPDGNGIFETAAPNMQFFTPETNEDWCFAGDYGASCPTINLTQFAGLAGLKLRFESFNRFGNNLYLRNIVLSQITELVDEQQDEGSWSVAPNPSEGSFVLSRTSAQHAEAFEVHDMQGRKVLVSGFDTGTFSKELDGFAPGMYLIISKEKTIKPLKLIIK